IKRITLTSDNNLVIEIEVNKTETNINQSQEIQVINDNQISSSKELQKVRNYLKESSEKSINQQKLNNILNSNNTNELTGVVVEEEECLINAMIYEGTFATTPSIEAMELLNLNVVLVVEMIPAGHGSGVVSNQTTKLRAIKTPPMKTSNEVKKIINGFTKKLKLRKYYGGKLWEGNEDMEGYAEEFINKEFGTTDGLYVDGIITSRRIKNNPPLEIENSEKSGKKKLEIINSHKSSNEVLVIDLKRVKKITLRNNSKLEIEFISIHNNQNVNECYLVNQALTNKQVDNSQDLKTVRDYLRETGKDSLNHQELAAILNPKKREFEIKLQVKDKDGEVKVLKSKTFLEITWYGDKGILNPGELVNYDDEYGKGSYRESKGEKIRFEKDGKSYDIIIKINEIKKGWFKDKVVETGGFFPAPGSDFTIENNDKTQN
ncbi:460_t:CDS:2, partial [Ambispora leptoticha]